MIGLSEAIYLFHALAGLCVGWLWGAFYGVVAGIGASVGGGAVGFAAGFLATRMPQAVSEATANILRKHRLLGVLFAVSGYVLWFGLGIAFWWFGVSFLRQ